MVSYYEHDFEISDVVYIQSDIDQKPSTVTGILLRQKGYVIYELRHGLDYLYVSGYEISKDKYIY